MDGIAWAASAMVAARTRLEIAAVNLANVSSDGFRRVDARGFLTAAGVAIAKQPGRERSQLRHTGRDFDMAIIGPGTFQTRDAAGHVTATRNGAFVRERNGTLRDAAGRTLLGRHGALHVPEDARVDERGRVITGFQVVDALTMPAGSSVRTGFLESSGVDAVREMIDVLSAERSFESAQKIVAAIDATRQKSADAARVQ
jgi:flagellar basal-body rod protein FlgF